MITIKIMGEIKKCRVYVYEGVEQIKPLGSYSMAPILRAYTQTIEAAGL